MAETIDENHHWTNRTRPLRFGFPGVAGVIRSPVNRLPVRALLLGLLLTGCADRWATEAAESLQPIARLIEHRFTVRPGTGVWVRRPVKLGKSTKTTLTSGRQSSGKAECEPDAREPETRLDCEVVVPPADPPSPVGGIALVGTRDRKSGKRTALAIPVDSGRAHFALDKNTHALARIFKLYRAPSLLHRTIRSEAITVPAKGAVLRFAIGVEEPAWTSDSAPVQFKVTASRKGLDLDLFDATLDPARLEADRGWREFEVPLGELAGESVKLQFLNRAAKSRDNRPSLPLWGDPTIFALTTARPAASPASKRFDSTQEHVADPTAAESKTAGVKP